MSGLRGGLRGGGVALLCGALMLMLGLWLWVALARAPDDVRQTLASQGAAVQLGGFAAILAAIYIMLGVVLLAVALMPLLGLPRRPRRPRRP